MVLGGQGGDEIFGGYVRYLIAYFEQCLKGAIAGVPDPSKFIVTYGSIIPNLKSLRGYEPLMAHFFGQGMFDDYDKRYYRLIDRSGSLGKEIRWESFPDYDPYDSFREVFFSNRIGRQCYFDSMLHFDFVTLLPALLQVEDRMSMAHGIESRTPFLDHPLVEFAATVPANVKFKDGELKRLPKKVFGRPAAREHPQPAGQDGLSRAAGRLAQGPLEADGPRDAVVALRGRAGVPQPRRDRQGPGRRKAVRPQDLGFPLPGVVLPAVH